MAPTELARRYFGESNPVGRQITVTGPAGALRGRGLENPSFEVVGVVGDMKNRGPREVSWPETFVPLPLAPAHGRVILVRAGDRIVGTTSARWFA
jgi:hypothetical protein